MQSRYTRTFYSFLLFVLDAGSQRKYHLQIAQSHAFKVLFSCSSLFFSHSFFLSLLGDCFVNFFSSLHSSNAIACFLTWFFFLLQTRCFTPFNFMCIFFACFTMRTCLVHFEYFSSRKKETRMNGSQRKELLYVVHCDKCLKCEKLKIVNKQRGKKGKSFLKRTRMPEHLEFFLSFTATNKNTVYYRICLRIHLVLFILNPFTLSMFFLFLSFSSFHVLPLISLFAVFKEERILCLKLFIFFDFD